MRLDVYLTQMGYTDSRERAKRLISAGAVSLDGRVVDKPAFDVIGDPEVAVIEEEFVGRGGEKLKAALAYFSLDVQSARALDIGASTGGFTQCLLKNGASSVVALDAGCGQLHPSLRNDERVTNIEKYNARDLRECDVGRFDLVVMDVSFISATYILPHFPEVMLPNARAVTLIKPQFEVGRAALNKKGLVKSQKDHIFAVSRVLSAAKAAGLVPIGLAPSPIKGGDGNMEYLACFALTGESPITDASVTRVVMEGRICK